MNDVFDEVRTELSHHTGLFFCLLFCHLFRGHIIISMSSLISLLLRGLSVYRWSNFSRIENPTALDHSAFTLQIAYLLTDLLLEKGSDIHVDRMTIYRHSLFSIFFTCTYSDIGSEVKARIRDAYPDYYRALCEKVDDRVATWQLPERAKVSMS